MPPNKLSDGRWLVDIRPNGSRSKRIRKKFDTKPEAVRFEAWCRSEVAQNRAWNPPAEDTRTLSDLVKLWYELHGQTLKDAGGRKKQLLDLCDRLKDPRVGDFSAKVFTNYRALRLKEVSANTVNHEHAYLRAVFNELRRLGELVITNPISQVRRIKLDEAELTYLDMGQIKQLLDAIKQGVNPHTLPVTLVCLATGARWSEAEQLVVRDIKSGLITFNRTKGRRNRSVPIDPKLQALLAVHRNEHGLDGGRLFGSCYASFGKAIERSGIELPAGQLSHVCRHTFASHFMMGGGNLLTLQKILDHKDIKMTLRYAHLAPDHLEDARKLNPIGHFLDG